MKCLPLVLALALASPALAAGKLAPAKSVEKMLGDVGVMANAVMRPEVMYGRPLKGKISGKLPPFGPMRLQAPAEGRDIDITFAQAFCASRVSLNGTSLAG